MAAILDHGNGYRGVQFVAPDGSGRRPEIRLGKVSKTQADIVRTHIDKLAAAIATRRAAPPETVEWLAGIGPKLHAKLVKHGLVSAREEERAVPLGPFLTSYVTKRTDLKRRTRINFEQAQKKLVEHFGADRDLRKITRGHALDFRRKQQESLSRATVATHIKKAKQFFQDAVDLRLIKENPFTGVKAGKQSNPKRQHYVSPATARKVIDHCPDDEWRALFALARFGGLRVPSETSLLKWEDLDFEAGRMTVHSPKTEHHEGRATRLSPIFPELRPYLDAARAAADPDARHVLAKLRATNPRTTARKIVRRAGLEPWPKLFQNLRSSCQTDLEKKHSLHVVCAWLGNTPEVAKLHYLQVTDDDFRRAIGADAKSAAKSAAGTTVQDCAGVAPNSQNRGFSEQTQQLHYPQGGAAHPQSALDRSTNQKAALRKALRSDGAGDLAAVTRAGRNARKDGRGPNLTQSIRRIVAATKGGAR